MSKSLIVLDFESFWAQDFSLSKLTTEEYIRSPQFEIIGVSVQEDDNPPEWYTGSHSYIRKCLLQYDWKGSITAAHNMAFDGAILSWILDIHPSRMADTLSMARAIHGLEVGNSLAKLSEYYGLGVKGTEVVNAKGKRRRDFTPDELAQYGAYCCNDVSLTYKLFFKLLPHFNMQELKIIDQTIKMFTEPVLRVDVPLLEEHLVEVRARKEKLLEGIEGGKATLMSNDKFAGLLRSLGVEPPMKISKTTGKPAFAFAKTDEEFKALFEHPDERVQALCTARTANRSTIEETRTERFISIGKRGLIPVPLSYYGAHTGRWAATGGQGVNFQNLPTRVKEASKLKKAIRAPEGYVIINSDLSSVEARLLSWLSGQTDLVDDFTNKRDVYRKMASRIYGVPEEEVTKDQRFVGKSTILGAGYGMGGVRFQAQLQTANVYMELEEAEHIIATYRDTFQAIPALWRRMGDAIRAMHDGYMYDFEKAGVIAEPKGLRLPNGLYVKYTNLRKVKDENDRDQFVYDQGKKVKRLYGGSMTENLTQAAATCIIKEQLLLVAKRYRVVLTVHDSIVAVAPEDEAEQAMDYIMQCMRVVPEWAEGCPLDCEAGYAESYGDC